MHINRPWEVYWYRAFSKESSASSLYGILRTSRCSSCEMRSATDDFGSLISNTSSLARYRSQRSKVPSSEMHTRYNRSRVEPQLGSFLPPPTSPAARLVSILITSIHPLKAQRSIKPIILIYRVLSVLSSIAQPDQDADSIVFITSLIDTLAASCQCCLDKFAAKA